MMKIKSTRAPERPVTLHERLSIWTLALVFGPGKLGWLLFLTLGLLVGCDDPECLLDSACEKGEVCKAGTCATRCDSAEDCDGTACGDDGYCSDDSVDGGPDLGADEGLDVSLPEDAGMSVDVAVDATADLSDVAQDSSPDEGPDANDAEVDASGDSGASDVPMAEGVADLTGIFAVTRTVSVGELAEHEASTLVTVEHLGGTRYRLSFRDSGGNDLHAVDARYEEDGEDYELEYTHDTPAGEAGCGERARSFERGQRVAEDGRVSALAGQETLNVSPLGEGCDEEANNAVLLDTEWRRID